jgi:hypothetical protein
VGEIRIFRRRKHESFRVYIASTPMAWNRNSWKPENYKLIYGLRMSPVLKGANEAVDNPESDDELSSIFPPSFCLS